MKKSYALCIAISCFLFAVENFAQLPFPYVDNLCYTERYVENVRVSSQLNTSTLTLRDKLRFSEKSFEKKHHEYMKTGKYPVHDIVVRQWTKTYPKWYRVADQIRLDESGVRAYFHTSNAYLPGGWSGSTYSTTEHGFYGTGERAGEGRFYHQNHSEQSFFAYNQQRSSVALYGYLEKHRFFYPTTDMLTSLTKQGYHVLQNAGLIQISSAEVRITWRITEKTIFREYFTNGVLVKSILTKYKFHTSFGQDLKVSETETTPDVLENGDCIEIVTEASFIDYSTACIDEIDLRSMKEATDSDQVNILPNPASDQILLILPDADEGSEISISSTAGQPMFRQNVRSRSVQVDVSGFPEGLYIVTVLQGAISFTSKFIKN